MRSPLEGGAWHNFDEVTSTQDVAAHEVREGGGGVFFALHQALGRGRFGREWHADRGDSLTMSLAFMAYAEHPQPWLIGMTVAAACAAVVHCELAWPNDLILAGRKLGGVLTEIVVDNQGRRVPVVGVGVNLNQTEFPPEIATLAASLAMAGGSTYVPLKTAEAIVERLAAMPEPDSWADLAPAWSLFDRTPGKRYRMLDGRVAVALGVGPEGQLTAAVDGETVSVLAAEAFFGDTEPARENSFVPH